jgi:hypothetical protein
MDLVSDLFCHQRSPNEPTQLGNCAIGAAPCDVNRKHVPVQGPYLTIHGAVDTTSDATTGVINRCGVWCSREGRSIIPSQPDRRISQHVDAITAIAVNRVTGSVSHRVAIDDNSVHRIVADNIAHYPRRRTPGYQDAVVYVVSYQAQFGY